MAGIFSKMKTATQQVPLGTFCPETLILPSPSGDFEVHSVWIYRLSWARAAQ
jgi:hypothetical protein